MNREIKFRFWNNSIKHPEYNKYWYDQSVVMDCLKYKEDHIKAGCSFEQFTDLQDKNGVDIYEGDILKDDSDKLFRIYYYYGGFTFKAKYWQGDLGEIKLGDDLILEPLSDPQNASWIRSNCIVIGNIHENAELLN